MSTILLKFLNYFKIIYLKKNYHPLFTALKHCNWMHFSNTAITITILLSIQRHHTCGVFDCRNSKKSPHMSHHKVQN